MEMSRTEISDLPNEILERILNFFCTETLERLVSQVCCRWKAMSVRMIERRTTIPYLRKYFPETLTELRTRFIETDSTKLAVLKEFEQIYVGSDFQIQEYTESPISEISDSESENEDTKDEPWAHKFRAFISRGDASLSVDKRFKFMACHQLIVRIFGKKVSFYHMSVLSLARPYRKYEIETEREGREMMSRNEVTCYDVYHDKLAIGLKTSFTRATVLLCQITQVCHYLQKLRLTVLKKIEFPRPVSSVALFKDKIYVLYSPDTLAVWRMTSASDEGEILTWERRRIDDDEDDDEATPWPRRIHFCRLNNLLFCRLVNYEVDPVTQEEDSDRIASVDWLMLDMNEDSLNVTQVSMQELLFAEFPLVQGKRIRDLILSGNVLLFHVDEGETDKDDNLFGFRIKVDPKKEDFMYPRKFNQLIIGPPVSATISKVRSGYVAPIPSHYVGGTKPTFVCLNYSTHESRTGRSDAAMVLLQSSGFYIG